MKKQKITDGNWDYLIILDACRYDDFEELYSRYLEGKLEKRLSRGSSTPEWLNKTFSNGRYDITYISTNPYVNSQGWSLKRLTKGDYNWNAKDKFKEVVDVWENKWSNEYGTVHPKTLVKETLKYAHRGNLIVHFVQPHKPYLTAPSDKVSLKRKILLKAIKPFRFAWFGMSDQTRQKIKKKTGFRSSGVRKSEDVETLRKYYRENLDIVLKYVRELVFKLPAGKMIITSDHGEAFGEDGVFNHPPNRDLSVLVEVPWLELETKGKKKQENARKKNEKKKSSEKEIKERLEALGYKY